MKQDRIGIVGSGVTGTRVLAQLATISSANLSVTDANRMKSQQLAALYRGESSKIEVIDAGELNQCKIVVLACSKPHVPLARTLLGDGVHVISMSDDVNDTMQLLQMDDFAKDHQAILVVGAAASPGLTALLIQHSARNFDVIDEAHIALHGTGGPDCAHQHHDALAGQSIGWHDDDWLRRPAGSGRELCWFPEPVGAYDCYRAEMSDPILLKHAMPQLRRITARMSATRRDRFTARLPMMAPPHAEGGMGSVRVEVRGWRSGARVVEIVGVAERVAQVAGVVAGLVTQEVATGGITQTGIVTLGSSATPNERLLANVQRSGIQLHEFVGN